MQLGKQSLESMLNIVMVKSNDASLRMFIAAVIESIKKKPELEVRISDTDSESVVYVNEQGRSMITTLGRLIIRQLKFDPQKYSLLIQILSDAYIAEIRKESVSYDIVNGNDIIEAYDVEYGAHSCMTGSNCKYVKFMAENPSTISILLFMNKSKDKTTKARALLWTTTEGDRVLDRIYPNAGWHIDTIKKWAKGNGIITRKNDGLPRDLVIPLERNYIRNVLVKNSSGVWSYMDTFCYAKKITGKEYELSNEFRPESDFYLWTTAGYQLNYSKCKCCLRSISPISNGSDVCLDSKTGVGMIYLCSDCFEHRTFICQNCQRRLMGDPSNKCCKKCEALIDILPDEKLEMESAKRVPVVIPRQVDF
ncbi:MAG: hypothetical protein WCY09_08425 [Candidatus Omnitrophota bacterium]